MKLKGNTMDVRVKRKSIAMLGFVAVAVVLAGCASKTTEEKPKQKRSKEYFAESKYGVKASPRVAGHDGKAMPRGGGRDQVGKPYKVKGRWYHPKEDKKYAARGRASWYGSAFHGRLTANGEVYDMTHLTAAHPTMPLPSYARVTNTANGSSVIVRVNDRGPYEKDRVIDLSQKAAELLDYQHHGTANVKVEYVGRAPLHGQDDAYLMASYQPGDNADPIGQPATGVMMAMNGPTPTDSSAAFAAMSVSAPIPASSPFTVNPAYGDFDSSTAPIMPAYIPVPSERPSGGFGIASAGRIGGLAGYANDRVAMSSYQEEQTYGSILTADAISSAWKRQNTEDQSEYVELGLFKTLESVRAIEQALPSNAKITRSKIYTDQNAFYELTAKAFDGKNDALLKAAWQAGATDAFVVRMD